ncbi:MAG: ABC transporter permease [Chloroflexota bacterium]
MAPEAARRLRTWVVVLAVVCAGLVAPTLAPFDPRQVSGQALQAPGPTHWLGTNDIAQDVLSQWLWAARASVSIALAVAAVSSALAWGVGLVAGLSARAEGWLMAFTDLLLALPGLPLYVLVLTLIGPSQTHVAILLGLLSWPAFARVVRALVITVRTAPYIEAVRCLGGTWPRVAFQHVLPATLDLLPAHLVLTVRFAVFAEATLAFLGLGDSAAVSWGTLLGWAFVNPLLFTTPAWTWLVLPPALGIALLILLAGWAGARFEAPSVGQRRGVEPAPSTRYVVLQRPDTAGTRLGSVATTSPAASRLPATLRGK